MIAVSSRVALVVLSALGAASTIPGCANGIAAHAMVRPTEETRARAERLIQDPSSDPALRLVYGDWPGRPTQCRAPHATPTSPHDRYGVALCDHDQLWSAAYFLEDRDDDSVLSRGRDDRRLAAIAADSLVPIYEFSRP